MKQEIVVSIQPHKNGLLATCKDIEGVTSFGYDWGAVKRNYSKRIKTAYPKGIQSWFVLDIPYLLSTYTIFTAQILSSYTGINSNDMTMFAVGDKFPTEEQSIQILKGLHEFSNIFYNRFGRD